MDDFDFTCHCDFGPSQTLRWKIQNFVSCTPNTKGRFVTSSYECYNGRWNLIVYPNGTDTSNANKVSIYLKKNSDQPRQNDVTFLISLQDRNGKLHYTYSGSHLFKNEDIRGHSFVDRSVLLDQRRAELLPLGTLTVICKITENVVKVIHSYGKREDKFGFLGTSFRHDLTQFYDISEGFYKLYLSGKFSDITLKLKDELIYAHKMVLADNSPVFAQTLKKPMVKAEDNTLDISDIPTSLFPYVLQYMYTGYSGIVTIDEAIKVYELAAKFEIRNLQSICREIIIKKLSIYNFCGVVIIAYTNCDNDLKNAVSKFLLSHMKIILNRYDWIALQIDKPNLAISALQNALLKILENENCPDGSIQENTVHVHKVIEKSNRRKSC